MYKKVILLSLVFSVLLFSIDKIFFEPKSSGIPDPSPHIRFVFDLLKNRDKDRFEKILMSEEDMKSFYKKMRGNYNENGMSILSNENLLFLLLMPEMSESYADYREAALDEFKEICKAGKDFGFSWRDAHVKNITWKLVRDDADPTMYRCNSKIYFTVGTREFCLKYKNFVYYQGQWYSGNFMDIDEITEPEYFPDMYNPGGGLEYYDTEQPVPYEEMIPAEESVPYSETESEAAQDEAMEED